MRYAVMLVLALILAGIVLLTVALIDKRREKKNARKYLEALEGSYGRHGILATLENAQKSFKEKSYEERALGEAVSYLKRSIRRDYETAFRIVEKGFPGKDVHEAHMRILEEEKSKGGACVQKVPAKAHAREIPAGELQEA